jgi:PAS domain-containing protein
MVEDDPNDAELIQAYLEEAARAGAQVRHVRTLAEALERAAEAQVTLLDLDLPDSSGLATLERMRAATAGPLIVDLGQRPPGPGRGGAAPTRLRRDSQAPAGRLDAAPGPAPRRAARGSLARAARGEGRYRALVESSSEALVLLDATGRVEYASAAMRRVLGFETSEALGRFGWSSCSRRTAPSCSRLRRAARGPARSARCACAFATRTAVSACWRALSTTACTSPTWPPWCAATAT